jgi:hypothetical protein
MRHTILLVVAAMLLITAGTASAAKPDKLFVPLDSTFDIVGLCEDDLVGQESGHIQFIRHFDRQGNVKFDQALPAIKLTVTNPETELSLTDMDVGLDKLTLTSDGGVVLSTGVHSKPKGAHGPPIFQQTGLVVITLDASLNVIDVEQHGNFDPDEEFAAAVCEALGTAPAA